jgi:hypothetical protein
MAQVTQYIDHQSIEAVENQRIHKLPINSTEVSQSLENSTALNNIDVEL